MCGVWSTHGIWFMIIQPLLGLRLIWLATTHHRLILLWPAPNIFIHSNCWPWHVWPVWPSNVWNKTLKLWFITLWQFNITMNRLFVDDLPLKNCESSFSALFNHHVPQCLNKWIIIANSSKPLVNHHFRDDLIVIWWITTTSTTAETPRK